MGVVVFGPPETRRCGEIDGTPEWRGRAGGEGVLLMKVPNCRVFHAFFFRTRSDPL